MTIPSIGRIVHYVLTQDNADAINRRRQHASENTWIRENKIGAMQHIGNAVKAGDVCPMMIVKAWGDTQTSAVNGKVELDGNDTFWVTSVSVGEGQGHFHWPKRIEEPKRKPTIAELEAILADQKPHKIEMQPDGSIRAVPEEPKQPEGEKDAAPKVSQ